VDRLRTALPEENQYERAIRNLCSLLRPGGLLLISELLLRNGARRAEHVAFRPLQEVTTRFAKTGFEVVGRVAMFVVMEEPLDSTSRWYCFLWKLMTYLAKRSEFRGCLIGGMLYPLELILTKVLAESSATQIVIWSKRRQEAIAR
jgi:hypothetical protein